MERFNNAHARISELEEAKAAAAAPWEVALAPHVAYADLLLAGLRQFAIEHEESLKRHHGRTIENGPFVLKYNVSAQAVETKNKASLAAALLENGYEELVRLEPTPYLTRIKALLKAPLPRKYLRELRQILQDTGTTIENHQTITVKVPSLKDPVQLQRRPFRLVRSKKYTHSD